MTEPITFEDRIAEQLRTYAAPAARSKAKMTPISLTGSASVRIRPFLLRWSHSSRQDVA